MFTWCFFAFRSGSVFFSKVDAKLGAINKMHHNENEHGMYLELRTEEIKGHLDGNEKNRAKFNELQKRLDHELAEALFVLSECNPQALLPFFRLTSV